MNTTDWAATRSRTSVSGGQSVHPRRRPTIGSLFSGYGGADLAVASVFPDAHPAWFVEFDKHPSTVLAAHWPDVPNYGDVTAVDWSAVEPVDILTGGYPCQPFSHAGKRKGTNDDRHLFPYVAAAVGVLRPRFVFLENVAGHLTLGGTDVIGTLTGLGYDSRWGVVRASDAGAPHRRARLFIVATDRDTNGRVGNGGWPAVAHVRPGVDQQTSTQPAGADRPVADARGGSQSGVAATNDESHVSTEHGDRTAADADRSGRQDRLQRAKSAANPTQGAAADTEGHEQRQPTKSGQVRPEPGHGPDAGTVRLDFGPYTPAVNRWEHTTGRPAPAPTEPGRNGPRLNPAFVEWMMGLPLGWVTCSGIPRSGQLKALGNGIVPQQMALALRLLLDMDAAPVPHDDAGLLGTPTAQSSATGRSDGPIYDPTSRKKPTPVELAGLIGRDA